MMKKALSVRVGSLFKHFKRVIYRKREEREMVQEA